MTLRSFKLDPSDGCYTASTRNNRFTYVIEPHGDTARCELWLHDETRMVSERICTCESPKAAMLIVKVEARSL